MLDTADSMRWTIPTADVANSFVNRHVPLTTIWNFRSLVRARADAEALEARAHAAEAVEAGLQSELRAAEAAGAEADAALARCQALEERLSELRAEQVVNRPATPQSPWQML